MTYKLIAITIIVESSTLALAQCRAFYTSTLHLYLPVHAFVTHNIINATGWKMPKKHHLE